MRSSTHSRNIPTRTKLVSAPQRQAFAFAQQGSTLLLDPHEARI